MSGPGVTVIAPLHNAEEYLEHFLVRIEATLRAGDELLLVDDGSADGTAAVISDWADSKPFARAIVNEENVGVAATRNRAVAEATTEYIWFVDHDDAWSPDILERLSAAADGSDVVICRAEYRTIDDVPGRIVDGIGTATRGTGDDALRLMLEGRVHGYLWTKLIRREILGVDPFPILSSQSDFVGVTRAIGRSSVVVTIPDVLYFYLRREGSITRHREPNLDNHLAAKDAMLAVMASSSLAGDTGLRDFFVSWFYAHAVAFVPVRSGASTALKRRGIALAQSALSGIALVPLLKARPRVGLEMATIRFGGNAYDPIVSVLLVAHDRLRGVRNRVKMRATR